MRPLRLDFPGARHHVMNRGARRENIFHDVDARRLFLGLLGELPGRFGIRLHGFALMPNHFHLMVESNGHLAAAIQYLTSRYVQVINARNGWDGPMFRGRYRNKVVDADAYWAYLLLYLHLNPQRAGFKEEIGWTSHSMYTGTKPAWLCTSELLGIYGGVDAYRSALEDVRGGSAAPPDFDAGQLWGPTDTGMLNVSRIGRSYNSAQALIDIEVATGRTPKQILEAGAGRSGNPARWLLAWWMRRMRLPHCEVRHLTGMSPALVTRMVSRVEDRRSTHPDLRRWVAALEGRAVSGMGQTP